jgi:hypothetical protein
MTKTFKCFFFMDWRSIGEFVELEIYDDDAESVIHELAHAYDCVGEALFKGGMGFQNIDDMIWDKYDENKSAGNRSEIKVSAITSRTLRELGLHSVAIEVEIKDLVHINTKAFGSQLTKQRKIELYEHDLLSKGVIHASQAIASWLKSERTLLTANYKYRLDNFKSKKRWMNPSCRRTKIKNTQRNRAVAIELQFNCCKR